MGVCKHEVHRSAGVRNAHATAAPPDFEARLRLGRPGLLVRVYGAQAAAAPNPDWEADETLRLKLVFNLDRNEALRCVVEAEGVLWIGSDKGLYTYQRGSEVARKVFPASGEGGRPSRAISVTCLLHRDRTLLIGTTDGLYSLDPKMGAGQKPNKQPMVDGQVSCLAQAGNTLWVGTSTRLYRWDDWDRKNSAPNGNQLAGPVFYLGWDDEGKRLWATTDKGIFYSEWNASAGWVSAPKPYTYQKTATFDGYSVSFRSQTVRHNAAAHPHGNSLWVQQSDNARDLIRLENVLIESEPALKLVKGVGRVGAFLTLKDQLWVGATELARPQNAPNAPGDGGLFRWGPNFERPQRVIPRDVRGLSQNGDTLWIAAKDGVYRLNGLEARAWHPTIVLVEKPTSSFFSPIFQGKSVPIRWKNVKNLAGRTTPELVDFKVYLNDLVSNATVKPLVNAKGEREFSATLPDLPAGDYRYDIRAFDLHENEAIANDESNDPAAAAASQSFSVASPLRVWLTRLGPPILILSSAILLLMFFVPLRRTFLVYFVGYRYRLATGDCPHEFDVVEQGDKKYRATYRASVMPYPEHDIDLAGDWPAQDLAEGIRDELLAHETTIRKMIDELFSSGAKRSKPMDDLEKQAMNELAQIEQLCTCPAQTYSLKRIRAGMQTYLASTAAGRSKAELAGILEECLREPAFFTAWLDKLRKGMSGQSVLVKARGRVSQPMGPPDR